LAGGYTYSGSALGVQVRAPNGGENWKALAMQNITWDATGSPDSFNLLYTTKRSVRYTLIAGGISGSLRSYAGWCPNQLTSGAKIRIQAVSGGNIITDESDAVFTINATGYLR